MIIAESLKNKVIISISNVSENQRVERLKKNSDTWMVYTENGFVIQDETTEIKPVSNGNFLDLLEEDGLFTYRCCGINVENAEPEDYQYSNWVRCGITGPIGYSFNNYTPSPGEFGKVICPDDLRYTYLWGTDFKATNGATFTDDQIEFLIKAAVADLEKLLNIKIIKTRYRTNPKERGLVKGVDYDKEEDLYQFSWSRIQKYGMIRTRQRPICALHELKLLNRTIPSVSLLPEVVVDKQKGVIRYARRPVKPTDTTMGIMTSIGMYGNATYGAHIFYEIDYDAGFENAADIPDDLREIIAKQCAVSLLNIVGDGLMSGFSSSSLSMDGISESFSSTQSATSAYFGARIKEYKDDIKEYIKENKLKFSNLPMGNI